MKIVLAVLTCAGIAGCGPADVPLLPSGGISADRTALVEVLRETIGAPRSPLSWVDGAYESIGAPPGRGDLTVPARVRLPPTAAQPFVLEDIATGMRLDVRLRDGRDVPAELVDGYTVYRGGHGEGVDVVHRPTVEGVEDALLIADAGATDCARRSVTYHVALSRGVAGVRFVSRTLELLDADGTPRLRMAPPWWQDRNGRRRDVETTVSGCAYDDDPRMPWGRPVVSPNSDSCVVHLAIEACRSDYPLVLDPSWTTTGSPTLVRYGGDAFYLPGQNKVIYVGWQPDTELYDPVSQTFSTTEAAPLNGGRSSALADDRVVLVGNQNDATLPAVYDPVTGHWSSGPPTAYSRSFLGFTVTALVDDRVLVVGGGGTSDAPIPGELFHADNASWSLTSTPYFDHHQQAALRLQDGRVVFAGGMRWALDFFGVYDLFEGCSETYDPSGDVWEGQGVWATPYEPIVALLSDGRVMTAGGMGCSHDTLDDSCGLGVDAYDTILWDPSTNSYTIGSDIMFPMHAHTLTQLPSGRVLLAGGVGAGITTSSTSFYDIALDVWTKWLDMNEFRSHHSAVLLPNGTVLVAGGGPGAEIFSEGWFGNPCAADDECLSGFCVDEVCCDSPCDGLCDACAGARKGVGADGACGPIAARADPDGDCAADPTTSCQQNGLCDGASGCQLYADLTPCGAATCSNGTLQTPLCDGSGSCLVDSVPCLPYLACADASTCAVSCTTDAECAPAYVCDAGECVSAGEDGATAGSTGAAGTTSSGETAQPPDEPGGCALSARRARALELAWVACALVAAARSRRRRLERSAVQTVSRHSTAQPSFR